MQNDECKMQVRHEGTGDQWTRVSPRQLSVRLGSCPDRAAGRPAVLKLRGQSPPWAGKRTRGPQRVVNPEQASKVMMRTPARLVFGEGRCAAGKEPTHAPAAVRRGIGSSARGRFSVQRGRSACVRGGNPQRRCVRRRAQKSERLIVPLKPGNAGGGKEPHFRMLPRKTKEGGLA